MHRSDLTEARLIPICMGKRTKKKSQKGRIIKDYEEFIELPRSPRGREDPPWNEVPSKKTKGAGIYALYDNHGLYYVGLTTSSLRQRIRKHTTNKHGGKWKRFSWFRTSVKNTKDLETAILRISNPKANRVGGRLPQKRKAKKREFSTKKS